MIPLFQMSTLRLRDIDQLAQHEEESWNLKAHSFDIKACAVSHHTLRPPQLQGQGCVLVRCYRTHTGTLAPPRQGSGGPGSRDMEYDQCV